MLTIFAGVAAGASLTIALIFLLLLRLFAVGEASGGYVPSEEELRKSD